MDVDELIRQNADPIWLYQNEMWGYIEIEEHPVREDVEEKHGHVEERDDEIPF